MAFPVSFELSGRRVGGSEPCFVIAEAGSNHNGEFERAIRLIDIAADACADAVKFQLFSAERLAADTAHPVARIDFAGAESLHELYRKNETPSDWMPALMEHAAHRGIMFLCTPFDEVASDLLDEVGVPAFKIASFELLHLPLLRHIARKGKPILLSTGMARIGDVEEALLAIADVDQVPVGLMHCGISYPLDYADVNLLAMRTMAGVFDVPVGYSDHTLGTSVPVAVAALGGHFVEKHFTESRALSGPDHKFALEPDELAAMVRGIRGVEAAVGSPRKWPADNELEHLRRGRRSLFAARSIPEGTVITEEMVAVLRPGAGLPPSELERVVGRQARRSIGKNEPITWDDI